MVLVTGASSGLGRAVALELGRSGVTTLLMARDEARLGEVAAEIARAGGEAVPCPADVRDLGAVHAAIGRAVGGRRLELVVHAAGVLELGPVDGLDDGQFARCFEVNVLGTSHVVQAALPRLAASRGRLVIVVSVAGLFALPGGFGAYAASKWALRGYAETVRAELRERGVGLTVAYPSILDTPMVQGLGPAAPAVYRAFPWHPADRVAHAILRDARRGRSESYATFSDRLAARAAGVAPHAFAAGMRAWIRRAGRI